MITERTFMGYLQFSFFKGAGGSFVPDGMIQPHLSLICLQLHTFDVRQL
jgi:hypothetical protein